VQRIELGVVVIPRLGRHLRRDAVEVGAEEGAQHVPLLHVQLRSGDAPRAAVWEMAAWSASLYPAASSMASLSFCSLACSTVSENRSSRQTPARGITRSP